MFNVKDYRDPAAKCSCCKFCQAVCPVFLEDIVETTSARGRVNLVEACLIRETLPPGPRFREALDRCLLCGSCVLTCPAGVPADEIIVAARHATRGRMDNLHPQHALKRRFMQSRGEDKAFAAALALGRKVGAAPDSLPLPVEVPFSMRQAKLARVEGTPRATVAYYTGCATNVFYPETAEHSIRALARNGVEVKLPEGLTCCGLPALVEGDLETARDLLRQNIEAISALGPLDLVTDCTSCAEAFRHWGPRLFAPGDEIRKKADDIAMRTFEATEYLAVNGLSAKPGPLYETVTYHVPCHHGEKTRLSGAPRLLLGAIPRLTLKEMEFPERCCGGGGSFHVDHPELSEAIRAKKVADIRSTGARVLVTQCPACRSYLGAGVRDIEIVHPLTLLVRAYG